MKAVLLRHLLVGIISSALVYLVWLLNRTWGPDMQLWKAFGGASFFLLWFTMFIGPMAKLWTPLIRLTSYRREVGIWFFLIALVHGYLILDGWVRWGVWEFLGYEYVPQLETYLRVESGFGLANLIGLVALVLALVLATTSFDKAVSWLGISSWKWLHMLSYVIFYLGALHVVYFAFIHYTPSLQRVIMEQPTNYPDNPLKYYYLFAITSVLLAQCLAFIKTVRRQRKTEW